MEVAETAGTGVRVATGMEVLVGAGDCVAAGEGVAVITVVAGVACLTLRSPVDGVGSSLPQAAIRQTTTTVARRTRTARAEGKLRAIHPTLVRSIGDGPPHLPLAGFSGSGAHYSHQYMNRDGEGKLGPLVGCAAGRLTVLVGYLVVGRGLDVEVLVEGVEFDYSECAFNRITVIPPNACRCRHSPKEKISSPNP